MPGDLWQNLERRYIPRDVVHRIQEMASFDLFADWFQRKQSKKYGLFSGNHRAYGSIKISLLGATLSEEIYKDARFLIRAGELGSTPARKIAVNMGKIANDPEFVTAIASIEVSSDLRSKWDQRRHPWRTLGRLLAGGLVVGGAATGVIFALDHARH